MPELRRLPGSLPPGGLKLALGSNPRERRTAYFGVQVIPLRCALLMQSLLLT